MKEQGYQWNTAGLPVHRYLGRYPAQSLDKTGNDAALPPDPCFILGNHRLTAFAHVSGQIEIISGERGWMRLNYEPVNGCSNRAVLTVHQGNHAASIMLAGEEPFEQADKSFGAGYAQYQKSACAVRVTRQISATPSLSVRDGLPCLRFRIAIENTSKEMVQLAFSEEFPVQGCVYILYEGRKNMERKRI